MLGKSLDYERIHARAWRNDIVAFLKHTSENSRSRTICTPNVGAKQELGRYWLR